jgi:hypothetical protein
MKFSLKVHPSSTVFTAETQRSQRDSLNENKTISIPRRLRAKSLMGFQKERSGTLPFGRRLGSYPADDINLITLRTSRLQCGSVALCHYPRFIDSARLSASERFAAPDPHAPPPAQAGGGSESCGRG